MRSHLAAVKLRAGRLDGLLNERVTRAHRRLLFDFLITGLLVFSIGCFWFSVGRYLFLGALLMFLPQVFTDAARVLDRELLRDRLGMDPHHGRHTAPVNPLTGRPLKRPVTTHHGAHPRPQNRQ